MSFRINLRRSFVLAALLALLPGGGARAWSGHTLCTWQALEPLAELAPLRVRAESLESFLADQAPQLERVLADHEAWARANLEPYAPRPDALAFQAADVSPGQVEELRARFLKALRLNAGSLLPLFLQLRPGEPAADRQAMPWTEITTLRSGVGARENSYVQIREGSTVTVIDVLATASNEPDYGLDLGLFADNGTVHGQHFGFGKQPFGNSAVDYSSQAPFHMGFYHEARIVFAAASFLRRTHPEARVALFSTLARHAFASGHDYWGWRFTGWALHYVQDLTQPYHASVLPGVHPARMIGINAVAMVGHERPKLDAIALVSNRHVVVENYQYKRMVQAYEQRNMDDALLAALRDSAHDREHWRYQWANTRAMVSREAFDAAQALDAQLEQSFPPHYTADPSVSLGMQADRLDMQVIARQHSAQQHQRLEQQVAARLKRLGLHTRALVRDMLVPKPHQPTRP